MISYYHENDKIVALHYALQLGDTTIQKILEGGCVKGKDEAYALSKFYWKMIEESVKDRDSGGEPFDNMDAHLENIFNAFYAYLGNNGYDEQWDQATDEA